jgi:hypothetical protein
MLAEAPALFAALEESALAAAIRQSPWAYATANVAHILGLFLFAGAVSIMDLTLLGIIRAVAPGKVVRLSRRAVIVCLLLMAASGSILFMAEASHVVMNPVFQIKAVLIGLALVNAALVGPPLRRALSQDVPSEPFPPRVRAAAALSLLIWISVAACGRLIAYL